MFKYIARAKVNEPRGLNDNVNTCRENTRIGTVVTRMHSIIDQPLQVRSPPTHPRLRKRIGGAVPVDSYRFVNLVCSKAVADQEAGRFASNLSHRIVILC